METAGHEAISDRGSVTVRLFSKGGRHNALVQAMAVIWTVAVASFLPAVGESSRIGMKAAKSPT